MFGCGKTQISVIKKGSRSYMKLMLLVNDAKLARDFGSPNFLNSMRHSWQFQKTFFQIELNSLKSLEK